MIEVKAPMKFTPSDKFSIYLAGSTGLGLEMGALDWQLEICKALEESDVLVLNPRRGDDWGGWIPMSVENEEYRDQVEWEIEAMEFADMIVLNLLPETLSPIPMLELGLYVKSQKLAVCCPKSYIRRAYVEILCSHYHIAMSSTFENLLYFIKECVKYTMPPSRLCRRKANIDIPFHPPMKKKEDLR